MSNLLETVLMVPSHKTWSPFKSCFLKIPFFFFFCFITTTTIDQKELIFLWHTTWVPKACLIEKKKKWKKVGMGKFRQYFSGSWIISLKIRTFFWPLSNTFTFYSGLFLTFGSGISSAPDFKTSYTRTILPKFSQQHYVFFSSSLDLTRVRDPFDKSSSLSLWVIAVGRGRWERPSVTISQLFFCHTTCENHTNKPTFVLDLKVIKEFQ